MNGDRCYWPIFSTADLSTTSGQFQMSHPGIHLFINPCLTFLLLITVLEVSIAATFAAAVSES